MKTTTLLAAIAVLALTSCATAPKPSWTAFNPQDSPQSRGPTVSELHGKNKAAITGNPSFLPW